MGVPTFVRLSKTGSYHDLAKAFIRAARAAREIVA
jgi:hypothetical protein